ncbi:MAG: GTPase HflX [Rickettsiales bacterium]|nr:GTPase HflX [Rickettsiales bacterium]
MTERCLVIHPHLNQGDGDARDAVARLEEAVGLAAAIHLDVSHSQIFQLKRVTPKTYIGGGQVEECKRLVDVHELSVVIVNKQLSPTQQRNLERGIKCKVIDRTGLILEIFGERAQTAEGRLQVELAALNYQKSRLVRSWTHLERQRGGAGFMGGPGETQIETDRRLLADRITQIKRQLEKVVRTRDLHRKTRRARPYPLIALVGYTNAGKSTLFNRLGGANVMAEDMLFATLDPTIRAITLSSGQEVLLSDTVGFISDLPHELIAAFRATLEEVLEADLLVHVRDISNPDTQAQKQDVEEVLRELCGDAWEETPLLEAWNKIDLVERLSDLPETELRPDHMPHYLVSAHSGDGIAQLLSAMESVLKERLLVEKQYRLQPTMGKAVAWLYEHGHVSAREDTEEQIAIKVSLSPANAARFEQMFMSGSI